MKINKVTFEECENGYTVDVHASGGWGFRYVVTPPRPEKPSSAGSNVEEVLASIAKALERAEEMAREHRWPAP